MSRSKWKLPFVEVKSIKNIFYKKTSKIFTRAATIPSILLNQTVEVYNGKQFKSILISRDKIGYKFGEFVPTRTLVKKKVKKLKKTKK